MTADKMPEGWKRIVFAFLLLTTTYGLDCTLAQINQFLDPNELKSESLLVESIGHYHQPFRVAYLQGHSQVLRRSVCVAVLDDRARQTTNGQVAEIVVGKGRFRKAWITTSDKHQEYNTLSFKIIYVGLNVALLLAITLIGAGFCKKSRLQNKLLIVWGYVASVALALALFYLV